MRDSDYRDRGLGWAPAWPGRGRARVGRGRARVGRGRARPGRARVKGARAGARGAGPLTGALVCLAMVAAACSSGPSDSGARSTGGAHGALAYSQCMRAHGITDFPDPNAQGGFSLDGINTGSPQFRAADTACQPKLGGGHLSAARQRQVQARMLQFAQCMRTHGVPGYPDPKFGPGGMVSQKISKSELGVDPNSQQFQAAQKACQHLRMAPGAQHSASTGGGS